jgi:hypothetical protein
LKPFLVDQEKGLANLTIKRKSSLLPKVIGGYGRPRLEGSLIHSGGDMWAFNTDGDDLVGWLNHTHFLGLR